MQNANRSDGTHDGHLGIGPGEHLGRAQRGRIHRDVGAAVGLARDDGDAGDDTLGERMQELGTATHDTFPLLTEAGKIAGNVDKDDQRHGEGVAHTHEARCLLSTRRVQAPTQAQGIVCDDAHRAPAQTPQADDDVGRPFGVQFGEGSVIDESLNQRVHVVGPA